MNNNELTNIRHGHTIGDRPEPGSVVIRFNISCPGNADQVLRRVKEVLLVTLQAAEGPWPDLGTWKSILPSWFVAACATERDNAEIERIVNLPYEEKEQVAANWEWSVDEWTRFFVPGERWWYWWDAGVLNNDAFWVEITTEDDTAPIGAWEWLFRVSGGWAVQEA